MLVTTDSPYAAYLALPLLDGGEVTRACAADDEAGWVQRYVDNEPFSRRTETLYGKVEFRYEPNPEATEAEMRAAQRAHWLAHLKAQEQRIVVDKRYLLLRLENETEDHVTIVIEAKE